MTLFKTYPFCFEDKNYEIRVLYDDNIINVVSFLDHYPANGYRHQIQLPKKHDAVSVLVPDVVEELVEMARSDIIEKRWDKVRKQIQPAT